MNLQHISVNDGTAAETGVTPSANMEQGVSDPSPAPGAQSSVVSHQSPAPAPKAGMRTTQFWLLAGVLALVAWMVFAGKLDAGWFALLAPAAALVYQCVRENLYRDASTHPHDALNEILETVLAQLPAPTSADATAVITALRDKGAPSAGVLDASNKSDEKNGTSNPASVATLALAGAILLALSGCAQTPYYVSGVNGTVDTSKDGAHITGGRVGVTISPNPYYPLPNQKGLTKQ